jgi:hypothetical protein
MDEDLAVVPAAPTGRPFNRTQPQGAGSIKTINVRYPHKPT